MLFQLILCFILLVPSIADAKINNQEPIYTPKKIKELAIEAAKRWDVDPSLLIAVMHIESRIGNQEFRVGKMGKTYYGPCGIHKCFLSKWNIADPKVNIEIGARALRGVGYDEKLQKRRLRKYNAAFNTGYWNAIVQSKKKYSLEIKNFCCKPNKNILK